MVERERRGVVLERLGIGVERARPLAGRRCTPPRPLASARHPGKWPAISAGSPDAALERLGGAAVQQPAAGEARLLEHEPAQLLVAEVVAVARPRRSARVRRAPRARPRPRRRCGRSSRAGRRSRRSGRSPRPPRAAGPRPPTPRPGGRAAASRTPTGSVALPSPPSDRRQVLDDEERQALAVAEEAVGEARRAGRLGRAVPRRARLRRSSSSRCTAGQSAVGAAPGRASSAGRQAATICSGRPGQAVRDVGQDVERGLIGPVQVVGEEHARARGRRRAPRASGRAPRRSAGARPARPSAARRGRRRARARAEPPRRARAGSSSARSSPSHSASAARIVSAIRP